MIIATITYGAELWILENRDIELLDKFQGCAVRRIHRFNRRTPNESSFATLGWMRLENSIHGKKLLFIWTITSLEADNLYKQRFVKRFEYFCRDPERGTTNINESPMYDILRVSIIFKLFAKVKGVVLKGHIYSSWRGKALCGTVCGKSSTKTGNTGLNISRKHTSLAYYHVSQNIPTGSHSQINNVNICQSVKQWSG